MFDYEKELEEQVECLKDKLKEIQVIVDGSDENYRIRDSVKLAAIKYIINRGMD